MRVYLAGVYDVLDGFGEMEALRTDYGAVLCVYAVETLELYRLYACARLDRAGLYTILRPAMIFSHQ